MFRSGSALMLCLLVVSPVLAQEEDRSTVKMSITPKKVTPVSLRYSLLPDAKDLTPGNAVQHYLKCFSEQNNFYFKKEVVEERQKDLELPLAELKKKYKTVGGKHLTRIDDAARKDQCDWQMTETLKADGFNTLLPEIQQMRLLSYVIKWRMRVEIANGEYDQAIYSATTLLCLGKHVSEHPTLIATLVGCSCAQMAIDGLIELISQPDAPNLYSALTAFPNQWIDFRKALPVEQMMFGASYKAIHNETPMTEEQANNLKKTLTEIGTSAQFMTKEKVPDLGDWIVNQSKNADAVTAAKKRLVEGGICEANIKKMPVYQVLTLDAVKIIEETRLRTLRWFYLPYPDAMKGLAYESKQTFEKTIPTEVQMLAKFLAGGDSISNIKSAHTRIDQQIQTLRMIEALRLTLAENPGKMPSKLDELSVPTSNDPATGTPFEYNVKDGVVLIQGKNIRPIRYKFEITIRK